MVQKFQYPESVIHTYMNLTDRPYRCSGIEPIEFTANESPQDMGELI